MAVDLRGAFGITLKELKEELTPRQSIQHWIRIGRSVPSITNEGYLGRNAQKSHYGDSSENRPAQNGNARSPSGMPIDQLEKIKVVLPPGMKA